MNISIKFEMKKDFAGSCITYQDGSWKQSHNLTFPRWGHSSWVTPQGVILMGGNDDISSTTSELVPYNSAHTISALNLQYKTRC